MDYKKFEDSEQEIFMNKFYNYEDTKLILTSIQQIDYPIIRENTKKGIKKGIEDFLEKEGISSTLYRSNLSDFCFDNSVSHRVIEKMKSLNLDLDDIQKYAKDVFQTYSMFVYNESRDRFINLSDAE